MQLRFFLGMPCCRTCQHAQEVPHWLRPHIAGAAGISAIIDRAQHLFLPVRRLTLGYWVLRVISEIAAGHRGRELVLHSRRGCATMT